MRGLGKASWCTLGLLAGAIACDGDARVRPPCAASMLNAEVAVAVGAERVDLLLVISDAASMADEQDVLRTQLPAAFRAWLSGEGMFTPIQDLRVAVVSASLADGGDLHRAPADAALGCAGESPSFLRYRGPYFGPDHDDPDAFVDQVDCLARAGTAGRAPNQSLEAALLALSDPEHAAGFLRNDPAKGLSWIQVVVIADSDDCSSPAGASSSVACAQQANMLGSVQHYVDGLKALRSDQEEMVAFSVLTGVPPSLVDEHARATADLFTPEGRDAYYQRILDDPAMQVATEPDEPGQLRPACTGAHASAEPGRRLIEAARAFGANGNVLSICSDDWTGLIRPLQALTRPQVDQRCLPHTQSRGADGRVECKVYWDLPPPDLAPEGTPTHCSQRRFLQPAHGTPRHPGGERCEVRQLAIENAADLAAVDPDDGGWYYDDFSSDRLRECLGGDRVKIAFTKYSAPQLGIHVWLDCFSAQVFANAAQDAGNTDAAACGVPDVVGPQRAPQAMSGVGAPCARVSAPARGFDARQVYLETAPDQCATGVCMIYHLQGHPFPDCTPCQSLSQSCDPTVPCATLDEIADRIYCTCRCDAGPDAPGCACPAGFSCQDTFTLGGPGYEGGYCVKDGTFESR